LVHKNKEKGKIVWKKKGRIFIDEFEINFQKSKVG